MKLLPQHIKRLTALERKVYARFIEIPPNYDQKRQRFISQSHHYVDGDENVLPFPERSTKGTMLHSLSQLLASSQKTSAVFLQPRIPEYAKFIKSKLLALGSSKVYQVSPTQATAAIFGNGKSPFWFYRENGPLQLSGFPPNELVDTYMESLSGAPGDPAKEISEATDEKAVDETKFDEIPDVLCAIDPPPKLVVESSEYEVLAVLLKNETGEEIDTLPLFAEAAHLGLLQVQELGHDRYWLSKDGT